MSVKNSTQNPLSDSTGRRNFLTQLVGVTGLFSIGLPMDTFASVAPENVKVAPMLVAPYLQNLQFRSASVVVVEPSDSVTWLELSDGVNTRKIMNSKDGFFEAGKGVKRFDMDGLLPGRNYQYTVFRRDIPAFTPYNLKLGDTTQSAAYKFSTPAEGADRVSCVILNDIHDRPGSFKDLMSLQKEPYDFVVLNGDMFDYQTDEQQLIDHLINPVTELFATAKPFVMVRGNHETRGKYARAFKDYFVYPEDEYFFTFQRGPVNFIVLDSGEDKTDDSVEYAGLVDFDAFRQRQAVWLEKELKSKAARRSAYNVVIMHIPPFHSGDWHGTMHCRKLFAPLFDKYKVDAVISGHTHRHGIHRADQDHSFPIVIGGGPKKGQRTLIHLEANASAMRISLRGEDGVEIDRLEILS